MANHAQIDSVDSLKTLRVAVLKFIENASRSLNESEGEIQRTIGWLQRDQATYWQGQIHKRSEAVSQARQILSRKKMFPTATGGNPSTIDEEKALTKANARLEQAHLKLKAVSRWVRQLEKEKTLYKAAIRRVQSLIDSQLPRAAMELDQMIDAIDAYLALQTPDADMTIKEQTLNQSKPEQPKSTELHKEGDDELKS